MNLSVGIVGLPNVGKSTLFNALLKRQHALVANYPFATIEPNVGVVPVPDERLERLAKIIKDENLMDKFPPIVFATVKFVDIAGLVKGAAQGEGLGNKFLSHIREVDAIFHVVRHFKTSDIHHVHGGPEPKRDTEIVNMELIFADLQTLEKQTPARANASKEEKLKWETISKLKDGLNDGKLAIDIELTEEEKNAITSLQLLTLKPMIFVANVDEKDLFSEFEKNVFPISAKMEEELAALSLEEQKDYLKSFGLNESGLERAIKKGYELLDLISFLTAGEKEVRAWTIKKGTRAADAAGVIHTDFSRGFIKAEVISYSEFIDNQGWKKAREKGKTRFEGKDYIIKDGEVIEFKVNV